MIVLPDPIEFEWDKGNQEKSRKKHGVTPEECVEAFFDAHKRMVKDVLHSANKDRYVLIGETLQNRLLFLVFTLRNNKVRVISARDMNARERKLL